MSKMACRCGAVISDTMAPCATEGSILREQHEERFYDEVCRDIVAFYAAVSSDQRDVWIVEFFSRMYPADTCDEGVIQDIIAIHMRQSSLSLCECVACGRLHAQRRIGENFYVSFVPDEPGYKGILKSCQSGGTLKE